MVELQEFGDIGEYDVLELRMVGNIGRLCLAESVQVSLFRRKRESLELPGGVATTNVTKGVIGLPTSIRKSRADFENIGQLCLAESVQVSLS